MRDILEQLNYENLHNIYLSICKESEVFKKHYLPNLTKTDYVDHISAKIEYLKQWKDCLQLPEATRKKFCKKLFCLKINIIKHRRTQCYREYIKKLKGGERNGKKEN